MYFMNECAVTVRGQGEFMQQYAADGGQRAGVNNLQEEVTV